MSVILNNKEVCIPLRQIPKRVKETDRQIETDGQTYKEAKRDRDRPRETERDTDRGRQTDKQTERYTETKTDTETDRDMETKRRFKHLGQNTDRKCEKTKDSKHRVV